MPEKVTFNAFKSPIMIQTLIEILNHKDPKPLNMTELRKKLSVYYPTIHNETVATNLKQLIEVKLVEENVEKKMPYEHTVWLTAKGKAAAEHFAEIDRILNLPPQKPDKATDQP